MCLLVAQRCERGAGQGPQQARAPCSIAMSAQGRGWLICMCSKNSSSISEIQDPSVLATSFEVSLRSKNLWTIAAMTSTRTFELDEASVAMGFYGLASAGAAPAEKKVWPVKEKKEKAPKKEKAAPLQEKKGARCALPR